MTTQVQTVAIMKLLAAHIHPIAGGLYAYEPTWDDDRIASEVHGITKHHVRGLRTQLKMKLEPKERSFDRLIRLHNELANRTANGDLVFEYARDKEKDDGE